MEKSGKADQLGAAFDLTSAASVQICHDDEIRAAIQELGRSTDAIAKQTETLKHQQEALARLIKNESKDSQARASLDLKHSHVLGLDLKSSVSAVADLSQQIELRVSELDPQSGGSLDSIQQLANLLLVADDKLLMSLQKLGWELDTEDPQEKANVNELRDICARLIKYGVEACRTRLDRVYLESLEAASKANGHQTIHGEDMATVQAELESLYSEVLPVAQMSVEGQYLEPALKSVSSKNGNSFLKTAHAVDYVRTITLHLVTATDIYRYVIVWTI